MTEIETALTKTAASGDGPAGVPPEAKRMAVPKAIALAAKHHEAGRLARAENVCRQILAAMPEEPDALHLMGVIAHSKGDAAAGIALIERAVAGDNHKALYHSNLCEMYRRQRAVEKAIAAGRRALVLEPRNAQVLNNLGVALHDHDEFAESETVLRKALALSPKHAEAHSNLGNSIRGQRRLEESLSWYRRAAKLRPSFADALANLGTTLKDLGQYDAAMDALDQAIAVDPKHANARSARALLLLLRGEYAAGWRDYEWRWQSTEMRPRNFSQPAWQGEQLIGRRLLIHAEQGMGDSLQFCRYLPLLRGRGGEIILEVQPALESLMAANHPWVRVMPQGTMTPFDQHRALVSLALMSGTTLSTVPSRVPYLQPEPEAQLRWAARLAALGAQPGLRVGITWAGNPAHRNDHNRSMAIEQLAPLFDVPGVSFLALQPGARAEDLARLTNFAGTDLSAELVDFAETAAVVANLDLVIAVDTAIVHLAGALAKPVWTMLPHVPDWRWQLERTDNPWYPTMRLFRQESAGDWAGVVARVAGELGAVGAGDRSKLLPRP